MNMSTDIMKTNDEKLDSNLISLEKRMSPGLLDEYYVASYIDNPFDSQQANLKNAMKEASIDGNATPQWANKIHHRNIVEIDKALIKKANTAKAMGLDTLIKLCGDKTVSPGVRAAVATTLTKELFPDTQVRKEASVDEMLAELADLRRDREKIINP